MTILFKAKRADNAEWAEGYYYQFESSHFITYGSSVLVEEETNYHENQMISHEITPETICRLWREIDGVKIWEGDIDVDEDDVKYTLKFGEFQRNSDMTCYGWYWQQHDDPEFGIPAYNEGLYGISGNIHDK